MANEAEKILSRFLARLQRNAIVRKLLAVCLLLALLCVAAYFAYDVMPRRYALTISGGDIVSNRHYLAKSLQEEAASHGVSLDVHPIAGSQEALALVDAGKLDLALIQGGLENNYAHVTHVATVAPELLHVLVRPEIKDIGDLRGKLVNLGSKRGGTRVITRQVLEFSGLSEGIDYVESNIPSEDLLTMRAEKLPDAIVITSFAPSDVADFLIKQRGFRLLEIPFPASLALRLGWVADSRILAYMYNVSPPVPPKDIKTIGVNLHLVANDKVDPRAIFKILDSLFSPALEVRLKMKMDESLLTVPSGFELSEGTKMFMARKNPPFSSETLDRLQALFGLLLSVASTVLVAVKWFLGVPPEAEPEKDDEAFLGYIGQVAALEKEYEELSARGAATPEAISDLQTRLAGIKAQTLSRMANANLDNPQLPHSVLLAIADARATIARDPLMTDAHG
ncbi:TAXI family TRAP transporter solute-binding subunit [Noviherbaspirillum sp.]|uniref:TAXI family TRAP transporter solute-binding subunit n=1 Tax=Noviherbaspirillum sp. TaxID=1926288 RepID=UPI002B46424E|nr:TAXI family TRAP transporter solute-binding subunit [Noviherbaspirillum sp.]HJV79814.1 TAXI family TRAP transporter solute-binding subunit [Noviherbaspirillum sp.]